MQVVFYFRDNCEIIASDDNIVNINKQGKNQLRVTLEKKKRVQWSLMKAFSKQGESKLSIPLSAYLLQAIEAFGKAKDLFKSRRRETQ